MSTPSPNARPSSPRPADMTRILLLSGSLRAGSTNAAVLATARAVAPEGVDAVLYEGTASLPHFNPDDDPDGGPVHPEVAELRAALRGADAVLICTPEYAGALPGAFKNVLEWTVGDASTYHKPVAWINASSPAAPTGGQDAHDSLRKVLGYVGADIVEGAVTRLPVPRSAVGADGLVDDPAIRDAIGAAVAALAAHAAQPS
jgi:NAD(P)H-dependent FMN reductase